MRIRISLLILLIAKTCINVTEGHSVSWGYIQNCTLACESNGTVEVTIWSGGYHDSTGYIAPAVTQNEGYLLWTPCDVNGTVLAPSSSGLFDQLIIGGRPANLIDGKTHFYSDFNIYGKIYDTNYTLSQIFLDAAGTYNSLPRSYQGRRVELTPGYYRLYYDTQRSVFTPAWDPKPGIYYGIIIYVGCSNCVKNNRYATGIAHSDAPTSSPTSAPSQRKF